MSSDGQQRRKRQQWAQAREAMNNNEEGNMNEVEIVKVTIEAPVFGIDADTDGQYVVTSWWSHDGREQEYAKSFCPTLEGALGKASESFGVYAGPVRA